MLIRANVIGVVVFLALVAIAPARALAHDQIYKGTVVKIAGQKIEVQVIDDTTKKTSPMVFEVTPKTKVFRGDREVPFADSRIQARERIVVTVNHDVSATNATIVRLAEKSGTTGRHP